MRCGVDGYPVFEDKHKKWLMILIEGMVSNPDAANCARLKRGNDLEIAIRVSVEDEHIFTPDVCKALKTLLSVVTGVFSPVVYLYGKPHPEAAEAINAALHDI